MLPHITAIFQPWVGSAGVNYPSDVAAGLALGRQVAALVIARGKSEVVPPN